MPAHLTLTVMTTTGLGSTCVVVPMFNEATVVGAVVSDLLRHFEQVVCIDDGSSDGSGLVASAAGAIVLRHPVNLGQGAALRTGLEFARRRSDISHVVTFDADGQHDPIDAVAMVEAGPEQPASTSSSDCAPIPVPRASRSRDGVCSRVPSCSVG